jgi:hypothetical protein
MTGRHDEVRTGMVKILVKKGEWLKHLRSSESTFFCSGHALLRRAISPAWRLLWHGERRGIGEEVECDL